MITLMRLMAVTIVVLFAPSSFSQEEQPVTPWVPPAPPTVETAGAETCLASDPIEVVTSEARPRHVGVVAVGDWVGVAWTTRDDTARLWFRYPRGAYISEIHDGPVRLMTSPVGIPKRGPQIMSSGVTSSSHASRSPEYPTAF